jgi:cysteine-rich secretory family protein/repeat uncharacterized protein DUF346
VTGRIRVGVAIGASVLGSLIVAIAPAAPVSAAGGWFDRLNLWRHTAGVPTLTENATYDAGDAAHSLYMVKNNLVTHYETPGVPYYTVAGDTAARNSNIEVNSTTSFTDEQAIDWWMGAPFHAMNMMDPRLQQVGFGSYREVKSGWQAGFSLNTLQGNSFTGGQFPVFWPGNNVTEPLTTYSGNEFPDPLQACAGYAVPTGLPVFLEVGGNVNTTVGPVHSFTGNGIALAHCVIDSSNAAVGSYLYPRGGVIVIPRQPLQIGVTYVVSLTVNGVPYTWRFTVGAFNVAPAGWQSLGGALQGRPAVSSWGSSRADVFVRGTDNALWHNTWNGSTFTGWASLGGVLTSSPAAISWSANRIDVFVRGTDNALYHRFYNGSAWSGWESLGGVLSADPTVASWASGRLDVFVRGSDNALYHKVWDGARWSGWEGLGGGLSAGPAAVSWGPNRVDVFVTGTDMALWHKWWDGAHWVGWQSLGGSLTSGPAAASCSSGHLDVFGTGTDYSLYEIANSGTWGAWQRVGGQWAGGPGAVCRPGTTVLDLVERGSDGAPWHTTIAGV